MAASPLSLHLNAASGSTALVTAVKRGFIPRFEMPIGRKMCPRGTKKRRYVFLVTVSALIGTPAGTIK